VTSASVPAILGGQPLSPQPLNIARPHYPEFDAFADRLRALLGSRLHGANYAREFEAQLAQYMNVPMVTVCNCGESALLVMLRAAGIDSGEVIVPAYTFSGTPHAVHWCGARPVFADIDPQSLCLDPGDVERRITEQTRAILAVDVYGFACDYDAFEALGKRYGLRILYDSAPAFGSRVSGAPIGGFGDAQAFSFQAMKPFTTMAGGCVASRDLDLVKRAWYLADFGQVQGVDCDEPGINAKMPEIMALIGIEQLRSFDAVVEHRNWTADRLCEGLAGIPGLTLPQPRANTTPVWAYVPVVVDPEAFGVDRNGLTTALAREHLHVRKYYELPCHHMAAYADQRETVLPHTEKVAYNVVALPIYNDMSVEQCDVFIEAIRRVHEHVDAVRAALARDGGSPAVA